ncbi:unnamed protein product [Prorocentrum cordatum]|uniref:FCP1 homology domain-containing protein n=1 Tax=Prorocentrum cordatum TaxID=2364126 RepID=A0ABN9VPB9_9DINO|nr:unnamed protein product [Polarella glacialis]
MAGASSSAGARKARRQRSNTKAMFRMRCTQRQAPGIDRFAPVRLVVFDFDECLTLLTYDVRETDPPATQEKYIRLNFESPWVDGSRLAYLRRMLKDIATSVDGQPRCIAVLTRNNMGVRAVLTILKLAGLADHFSAVWSIPYRAGNRHGAYRDRRGSWLMFDPPILDVPDHKADVLQHMADHPVQWFPQAANGRRPPRLRELFGSGVGSTLKLEEFVLVDDQRANFQSASGAQVLRYGKVARYDAPYSNMGVCKNMGGIGAHSELDYRTLKRFVEEPWLYSETLQVACYEQGIEDNERVPVEIVVFDFDETLTIATFMPQERGFREEVGFWFFDHRPLPTGPVPA